MSHKEKAVLDTLNYIARKYRKAYCYPCQAKILKLLAINGYDMCLRTLNYILKSLEVNGYIQRVRRHYRDKGTGEMIFRSTLYKMKKPTVQLYVRLKKQAEGFLSNFRLQRFAKYTSQRGQSLPRRTVLDTQDALSDCSTRAPNLIPIFERILDKRISKVKG